MIGAERRKSQQVRDSYPFVVLRGDRDPSLRFGLQKKSYSLVK